MTTTTAKVTAYKDPKLPPALVVSDGPEWADALHTISAHDAEILLAAIRAMYPHRGIAEHIYRRVILHFDRLAAHTDRFHAFCKSLAAASPIAFTELADSYRIHALKRIETTPEFLLVQRMAVRYLYDDVELWAEFGYEGASVHLGGYVRRGFNDLDWLPDLPNDL